MRPEQLKKPSKKDQMLALESYNALSSTLESLKEDNPEIEITEAKQNIRIPLEALKLLSRILKANSEGKPVSIVPIAAEVTTQVAADMLGVSRPHFIKILEEGKINYTMVGRHRRVKYEDVHKYRKQMKSKQEKLLIDIMSADEEAGLYDS